MFVQMNNIDINKENWIKTIRKFYSAVNELIDILGKDMNEWGYDRETMEKKIQAYVNYFDDAKEWDELAKWKNNDEDKDLLFDKVQDDVLNIMSLSTSKEDANKARKALKQLSDATSTDVMDVLKGCIDDGWKTGEHTRHAKKKLIMNNVSSIYEKEETNNWTELYYNVVHWKYQILHGDKIYTTKRGSSEKNLELDLQDSVKVEEARDSKTWQIEENITKLEDVETKVYNAEEAGEIIKESGKVAEQSEQPGTIDEQQKWKDEQLEDEVELSEENIIEKLKKIQDMEGYKELERCNDAEFLFLAQQLLKSSEAIDLLKKISVLEGNEWSNEELISEFKSMIDKLFANFSVSVKHFDEWPKILGVKDEDGKDKSFELIKSDFLHALWLRRISIDNLKTISEYMAFICFMNNIKNSVIETRNQIRWKTWAWTLKYLLWREKEDEEIKSDIEEYLIKLLDRKIIEFEGLKQKESGRLIGKGSSRKMEKLKMEIELDFDSLVSKNSEGKYSLKQSVKNEIENLVNNRNQEDIDINWLMKLFLPVFIKIWIFGKANDDYSHHWFEYVDTTIKNPVVKYVINWRTIVLDISRLKNFKDTVARPSLIHYYYDFKNVVLYAIYKTIKENNDCPYGVELRKDDHDKPTLTVYNKEGGRGGLFFEDSHYDTNLEKIFDEGDLVANNGSNTFTQSDSWDAGESAIWEERDEVESGNAATGIQAGGESGTESVDASYVSSTKTTENHEWENSRVEDGVNEVEKPRKGKKEKENNVTEGKEKVKESITIEDIIDFYANGINELERLKSLKKAGSGDQRNLTDMREKYIIKISKPGKKWITLRLDAIVGMVCEATGKKVNKPFSEKWFNTFLGELKKLIENKKIETE